MSIIVCPSCSANHDVHTRQIQNQIHKASSEVHKNTTGANTTRAASWRTVRCAAHGEAVRGREQDLPLGWEETVCVDVAATRHLAGVHESVQTRKLDVT